MPLFSTGWAAGDVVGPHSAELGVDVVEDAETWSTRGPTDNEFNLRLCWQELGWNGISGNQSGKLLTGHLGKRIQVTHLLVKIFIGTIKPEPLSCAPVNSQRSTDGITVPAGLQRILLGEDLDSFPLPTILDCDT